MKICVAMSGRETEREREREVLEHRGQRISKPILENTQKVMLT